MRRHLQCAEQQDSSSNVTKYCTCHLKYCAGLKKLVSSRKNPWSNEMMERHLRKGWQSNSHQPKPFKKVPWGALAKDLNTSRGFVSKPFKTAATKTARTLPTERPKKLVSSKENPCSNEMIEACKPRGKTLQKSSLRCASERFEHHQVSCPSRP